MSGVSPHSSVYLGEDYVPRRDLVLSETDLHFELTLSGVRTPEQILDVTNGGTSRIKIRKVVLTRGQLDFHLVNPGDFPDYLNPGETFNIVVDFAARVDGIALGVLQIYTNEDHLPYIVGLWSRTQRVALFSDLYADVLAKIAAEASTRAIADTSQNNARILLDATLRGLITSTNQAERNARIAADLLLQDQIDALRSGVLSGSITAQDDQARAWIIEERGVRLTADSAEAWARLQLGVEFDTAISQATAMITEESYTRATAYDALAMRTLTIEATYQTQGDVEAISTAKVTQAQIAWAGMLAAEASIRTSLIATVVDSTDTKLGLEAITRSAAIMSEQSARIAGDTVVAETITTLTARTSGARGITPNGTFEAGIQGWISGMTFIDDNQSHKIPTTSVGAYQTIYSAKKVPIDPNRAYQLNCVYRIYLDACLVYFGLGCYDNDGNFLGNIYDSIDSGSYRAGTRTISNVYTGEETYPIPTYRTGHRFPTGTTQIELLGLINYPNPVPVENSYGKITYLWLDDITNAYAVDARVTQEAYARTTSEGSVAGLISTLQANYSSARSDIDGLISVNGQQNTKFVQTNARIDDEQFVRANAILAEATRVNTLIAGLAVGDGLTLTQVNAIVQIEATARATADQAEATRVDNLLTNYSTNSARDSAINIAVSAEASTRTIAISNAVQAEATRVDNLLVNYETKSGVDGKIITSSNAQVIARDAAIATAVSAEASRVDGIIAGLSTGDGVTMAQVNAAVQTETNARVSAIQAEASRVDGIFVNYATNSSVAGSINAATQAEVTDRNSAIANAMSAEVTRVSNLLVNYSTTSSVNGAISTAVSAEISNRDAAIANAMAAEVTRVSNLIASYSTTGAMNAAISGAVSSEAGIRLTQDQSLAYDINQVSIVANGIAGQASQALTAALDAQGKLTARVVLRADVGNGRAQLELFADSYGAAGADLIGNLHVHGDLIVDGSMTSGKFAASSVMKTVFYVTTGNTLIYYG